MAIGNWGQWGTILVGRGELQFPEDTWLVFHQPRTDKDMIYCKFYYVEAYQGYKYVFFDPKNKDLTDRKLYKHEQDAMRGILWRPLTEEQSKVMEILYVKTT